MINPTAQPSYLPGFWPWIVAILLIGIVIWAIYELLIAPNRKKRHILESIPYCPSLLLPQLPSERDKTILVASHRLIHFNYRVNLCKLTCTCLRFRRVRRYYPPNDVRRLCRHLRKELQASGLIQEFDELTRGLITSRLRDACYIREPLTNSEMIIGFHPRSSIVRVYTYRKSQVDPPGGPFTGPVDKFTYNHRQEIWVYGDPPPNQDEILTVVETIMTQCRARYPQPGKLPRTNDNLITPIPETEIANEARARRESILAARKSTTPLQ
ncbi:MAG: hypothetical protein HQL95_04680 [Magnetococcales bacterium]|nr:hypothetical protein [Magnetococcales bacterium]